MPKEIEQESAHEEPPYGETVRGKELIEEFQKLDKPDARKILELGGDFKSKEKKYEEHVETPLCELKDIIGKMLEKSKYIQAGKAIDCALSFTAEAMRNGAVDMEPGEKEKFLDDILKMQQTLSGLEGAMATLNRLVALDLGPKEKCPPNCKNCRTSGVFQ